MSEPLRELDPDREPIPWWPCPNCGAVPDLIRTVADYEGLPDGTILEVVEVDPERSWIPKGELIQIKWRRGYWAGRAWLVALETEMQNYASYLPQRGVVCSVVRLGGSQ